MADLPAGIFVTFEGPEGAGKTTQIALLADKLRQAGQSVCVTREPGGDAVAETVRRLVLNEEMTPRAELLLFLAARAQHVERVIRPQLAAGSVVLCDRFIDSSIAYQGCARGIGRDVVYRLNAFAIEGLLPHLTFLLDLAPEIGLSRQTDRNRMEAETLDFHRRVRQGFLLEAENNPQRICVLDATESVPTLHASILERVTALIEERRR